MSEIIPLQELVQQTNQKARFPVYHGTPVAPDRMGDTIKASQSLTLGYKGEYVPHGQRAVSLSANASPFPVIRSLFHEAHPRLAHRQLPMTFARETDKRGTPNYFIGADALNLLAENGQGYVYGCEGEGTCSPFPKRADLCEYRSDGDLSWLTVAPTTVAALPSDLKVIDASRNRTWEFLDALPQRENALALGDEMGITIYSVDDWRKMRNKLEKNYQK